MTYFSDEQVKLLLKPIHPKRVLMRAGMSYVEGYDIKAELNRVFGFGRWSVETLGQALICDDQIEMNNKKPGWYVVYRTSLRLTICAPDGTQVCRYEESHVGESTHPVRGEAHGNALTNSWTYALKRCASNLGDQFGLSLYGKGSMDALVRWTLVRPEAGEQAAEVNHDDVPQVTAEEGDAHREAPQEIVAPPAAKPVRPAVNGKARTVPPADAVTDLDWMTHLVSDLIPAATTAPELETLWNQVSAAVRAGTCTAGDEKDIGSLITGRAGELGLNIPVAGKTPAQRLADQAAKATDMPSLKAVADEAREGGLSRETVTAPNGKTGTLAAYITFCRTQFEGQKAGAAA